MRMQKKGDDLMRSFDYVIVGAGSAGCVLANRLSENGKHSVCLVEAGPSDSYPWIHIPIGYGKTMFHRVYNWGFETEPDPNLNNRKIYWPRGRVLGGSSSINGLIYIRGQKYDYDLWARNGNIDWGWDQCLPYFKKLEHNDLGASETRGVGGPMWATTVPGGNTLVDAFIAAGGVCGVPHVNDFNDGHQEGVGYFQLSTRKGFRCSTAVGYLKPARKRSNLTVETNAQVMKVTFNGKRATGVQYKKGDKVIEIKANREVLLSAGAIQSPHLLMLSGIGNREHLSTHGINVLHHLPGVGENLQDHLQFRLMYEVSKPITINDQLRSLSGKARIGMQWILNRSGPLAIGINMGGMFCKVLPGESATPDTQFHFATLSADNAGGKVHSFSGCTYSVCQLRPESRGVLRLRSKNPFDAIAIHPNYLSSDTDKRFAVASVKFARKVASSTPINRYMKKEYRPSVDVRTDDEILEFCRQYGATIFHPAGTAKMGLLEDPMSVVDQQLRVHGIDCLRVVDCSVMPTLVSGNTNIPTVMIAERASDFILESAQQQ